MELPDAPAMRDFQSGTEIRIFHTVSIPRTATRLSHCDRTANRYTFTHETADSERGKMPVLPGSVTDVSMTSRKSGKHGARERESVRASEQVNGTLDW